MNFIDQVYVALIYVGSELTKNIHIFMGAILAMTISYLKTSRDKKPQNWAENLLCGIFAGIALTGISIIQYFMQLTIVGHELELPIYFVTGIVAGWIAWHGTEDTVRFLKNLKDKRNDSNKE